MPPLTEQQIFGSKRWPSMQDLAEMEARLGSKIDHVLRAINRMETEMANDFTKVEAAVAQEDNVIDSAIVLINSLAGIIRNTAPDQAAIDQLAADVQARADALAKAIAANTGAAQPPQPAQPAPPQPEA